MSASSVAIIGGGWAGMAAAVTLADAGIAVTVYETAPVLGGRARRVERDGLPLDNGQHLLLGAYVRTLALVARVHGDTGGAALGRGPLALRPFGPAQEESLTLDAGRLPGRLGLLWGLLSARGLTLAECIANLRWFRDLERTGFARPARETVARMLLPLPPRVARLLWEPLCLAALNTPAATASAQVFANVLQAAFAGAARASDCVVPHTDLSALFPEAAAAYVEARDGAVRTGARATVVAASRNGVTLALDGRAEPASAVIVAVGPHQLRQAFAQEALAAHPPLPEAIAVLDALAYEPIVTVWLGYPTRTARRGAMWRLDDAPGQWAFDRPDILARAVPGTRPALAQLLSVVVSANGPHAALAHDALVRAVDAQLRRLDPAQAPCTWSQAIAEKRATYACTPGRARLSGPRLAPGIYVAGDYLDDAFPATLEAAVRRGEAAAQALLADRGPAPGTDADRASVSHS